MRLLERLRKALGPMPDHLPYEGIKPGDRASVTIAGEHVDVVVLSTDVDVVELEIRTSWGLGSATYRWEELRDWQYRGN